MLLRCIWTFCLLVAFLGSFPNGLPAQERPPAYLSLDEVDDDFPFQGEYRGWQQSRPSSRSSEPIGLQVMAIGEGNFQATKYYGGLPGDGWFGGQRFEYSGQRSDDLVHVGSEDYSITIDGKTAEIYTADGRHAGTLKRVHRESPSMGTPPPPGAIVLFDGRNHRLQEPTITEDRLLREGTETTEAYGDFRLHAEYCLPYKPLGRGQDRGNSGFYLQSRYEVQVLDSFGLEGVENECGALYRQRRPDFNMCLPPLTWQTYDIDFTMPQFDENGQKIEDGRIAIWHNGILIHNNVAIQKQTGHGKKEGPDPLPTKLQDHNNPVLYRNIWLLPKAPGEPANDDWVKLDLKTPPVPIQSWQPAAPIVVQPGGVVVLGTACR